jgi:hypothetical protein
VPTWRQRPRILVISLVFSFLVLSHRCERALCALVR